MDYDVEKLGYGWEGTCPCGCGGAHHHGEAEGHPHDGGHGHARGEGDDHGHAHGHAHAAHAGEIEAGDVAGLADAPASAWLEAAGEAGEGFGMGPAFDLDDDPWEDEGDVPEPALAEFDFPFGGVSLHARRWGDAADIPLVLLHGFMQTGATWAEVAPRLARGHCLYALDLVGHGKSGKPDDPAAYAIPAQSDAIAAFIAQAVMPQHEQAAGQAGRTPARRAHVLGYSMGGRIALDLALRHPEVTYALILESAGIGPADEAVRQALAERAAGWARMLRADGMEAFVDYWEKLPLFATQQRLPAGKRAAVRAERLANDAGAMALVAENAGQHTMAPADEYMETLGISWIPAIFLAGTRDDKYLQIAERFMREGLEAKPVMAGHDLHLEAPAAFCGAVEAFLRANELRLR